MSNPGTYTQVDSISESKQEPKSENKKDSPFKSELKQYQKKTLDSYGRAGVADKIPYDIYAKINNIGQLNDFLRKLKEDKQPIQKIIQTMKRIPVTVRDKTGKPEKKDFLVVNSTLVGYDWMGNIMRVFDYFEGYHWEPQFTTTYKRDFETGDMVPSTQYTGDKKIYDIELTDKNRKQVIQDVINNAHGTFIEEIKFYYEVPDSVKGAAHRDDKYDFSQFINSSPQEMEALAWSRPSVVHPNKDSKGYHG